MEILADRGWNASRKEEELERNLRKCAWENEACIVVYLKIEQFEHCKRCELDGNLVRNNENRDRLCR